MDHLEILANTGLFCSRRYFWLPYLHKVLATVASLI
jgi:hypothetical protein